MRLVLRGRDCSDWFMLGAGCDRIGFGLYERRHSSTIMVCIFLMFWDVESGVGGVALVLLMIIVFPFQFSNMVSFICLGQFVCRFKSCRGCVGS